MCAELFRILSPHFVRMAVGRCLDEAGRSMQDYISFYSNQIIYVRGGAFCEVVSCDECNRILYTHKGRTRRYVVRHQLTGQDVYTDYMNCILISENLYKAHPWSSFRDLELYEVPVLDMPIDGKVLPGDPAEWANIEVPREARR